MIRRYLHLSLVDLVIAAILLFAAFICLYPYLYVFSMSISSPEAVLNREVWLLPKGFSVKAYLNGILPLAL
jgi:putative aldouronate transport system permease protein